MLELAALAAGIVFLSLLFVWPITAMLDSITEHARTQADQ